MNGAVIITITDTNHCQKRQVNIYELPEERKVYTYKLPLSEGNYLEVEVELIPNK